MERVRYPDLMTESARTVSGNQPVLKAASEAWKRFYGHYSRKEIRALIKSGRWVDPKVSEEKTERSVMLEQPELVSSQRIRIAERDPRTGRLIRLS